MDVEKRLSLRAVHHAAVTVRDLDAAEHFYARVLGLAVFRRFAHPDGTSRSIWVALGDSFLALERVSGDRAKEDGDRGWHCVALAIGREDRDAWRAKLEAAGISIERESEYTIYVRDPDGALIGLSHYPDR
jgi:glyoxylase I family protein